MTPPQGDRLQELILYIAKKSEADERFGRVKLAKLLFYADFDAYARSGEWITGTTYHKAPQGPVSRAQLMAERDLEFSGALEMRETPYFTRTQRRPVALRDPQLGFMSAEQLQYIDARIEQHWHDNASDISDLSHNYPGWALARDGEEIPYHTVFISQEPPTQQDIDRTLVLAEKHGWP